MSSLGRMVRNGGYLEVVFLIFLHFIIFILMLYSIAQEYLDDQFHTDAMMTQKIQMKVVDQRLLMDSENVSYATLQEHNIPLDDEIVILNYHIESSYNIGTQSPVCIFQINEIEWNEQREKVEIEIDLIDFESNPTQVRKMLKLITSTKKLHYKTQNSNKLSQLLRRSALLDQPNEIPVLVPRKMNREGQEEGEVESKKLTKSQKKYMERLEKLANGLGIRYTVSYFKKFGREQEVEVSKEKVYSRKVVEFVEQNAVEVDQSGLI